MHSIVENSHRLDPETGKFISVEHQRIAEIIKDYEPYLELAWIPPEKRELDDTQPFAILHREPGKPTYVVRTMAESEMNESIIAWLFMNDQQRGGQDLQGRLEKMEAARKALDMKASIDKMEEAKELARAILTSPLNYYKHNGVKYQ